MLHVTNGDCAAELIQSAGIGGDIISWLDALHEGPIPAGLSFQELAEVRARYLAEAGYDSKDAVWCRIQARDEALRRSRTYPEVILWFEHDLYDQLQLLQILSWFNTNGLGWSRLSLIQADDYLGTMKPARLQELFQNRQRVTRTHCLRQRMPGKPCARPIP